jgi:hypothetical protein
LSRFVSSDNAAESVKVSVTMCVLVDLDFASGHIRAHDGVGDITFGGNTFAGVGKFGSIDAVDESSEIIAKPLKLTLSGVDASLLDTATTENYQGRNATVYLGLLRHGSRDLIADPEVIWEGLMDTMGVRLGKQSFIELNCEHRLRREPRIARYTTVDQQLAYTDDKFFDLVPLIPGLVFTWGARTTLITGPVTPPGRGRDNNS